MMQRISMLSMRRASRAAQLPIPTLATVFEIVTDGQIHRVPGASLQRWIMKRRQDALLPP